MKKTGSLLIALGTMVFLTAGLRSPARDAARVSARGRTVTIENALVRVDFDLDRGTYAAADKRDGKTRIADASAEVGVLSTREPGRRCDWRSEAVRDALGGGERLRLTARKDGSPAILLDIALYEGLGAIVLGAGIDNTTGFPVVLRSLRPLRARAFAGEDLTQNLRLLDGNGGGEPTRVTSDPNLKSRNNLLLTFGSRKLRRSLVMGGLTYADYEKFAAAARPAGATDVGLDLWGADPVGRLVDPGASYVPADRFYVDFTTDDPFAALEAYGRAVAAAQAVKLNLYTFPSVCLWYVTIGNYGGGPAANDSTGAVREIEQAARRGFLKYSPVAIRLVPDNYDVNNEQGWWDDAHFQALGEPDSIIGPHYKPPYETTKKWAEAVRARGGIPLLYIQTARRSEDYCQKYPGHLLFNSPLVRYSHQPEGREVWWYGDGLPYWGYDFTDPGFVSHMREVYANFRSGGVAGLMYDYPSTGWAFDGGFEDKHATTAAAYRAIFELARTGLGEPCWLDERNLGRGSDITLGLVASQRVWGDTDRVNPAMLARCGLRWYKNRVVVSYDMDAKNPFHCRPDNRDGWRSMFTMAYVVSGRLLLGASFSKLTDEQLADLSRTFPYHSLNRSARPVDAFGGGDNPQVYDFEVNAKWHQITFLNTAYDSPEWKRAADGSKLEPLGNPVASRVGVELGAARAEGGLGLDSGKNYYIYDFWNDRLAGVLPGGGRLEQDLRPGEARMLSIHEAEAHPQFLSTSRHVMQGLVDMPECGWDAKAGELKGISKVVGGETYRIIVALNGFRPRKASAVGARAAVRVIDEKTGLAELFLDRPKSADTPWSLSF